jgi:hypothetical protein
MQLEFLVRRAPGEHERFARSYQAYPVHLLAIVVTDLFIGTQIDGLRSKLMSRTDPNAFGTQTRNDIDEFLGEARASVGGFSAVGPITFGNARRHSSNPFGHNIDLPDSVDCCQVVLVRIASGIVVYAQLVVPSTESDDPVEATFRPSNMVPVDRVHGSWRSHSMEAAKSAMLRRYLDTIVNNDLRPSGGLLGPQHDWDATLVLYTIPELPGDDSRCCFRRRRTAAALHALSPP